MVDTEKLLDLAKQFDNQFVKVLGVLPQRIKLNEVIGVNQYPDKTTKITIRRGKMLYLCWVESSEVFDYIMTWKEEIKARPNPEDRWEPWELMGNTTPLDTMIRLLKSRKLTHERMILPV